MTAFFGLYIGRHLNKQDTFSLCSFSGPKCTLTTELIKIGGEMKMLLHIYIYYSHYIGRHFYRSNKPSYTLVFSSKSLIEIYELLSCTSMTYIGLQ